MSKEQEELNEFYELIGSDNEKKKKQLMKEINIADAGFAPIEILEKMKRFIGYIEEEDTDYDEADVFIGYFNDLKRKYNMKSTWEVE